MGSDDLFKKRREARKQRQYDYKTPKANSFFRDLYSRRI